MSKKKAAGDNGVGDNGVREVEVEEVRGVEAKNPETEQEKSLVELLRFKVTHLSAAQRMYLDAKAETEAVNNHIAVMLKRGWGQGHIDNLVSRFASKAYDLPSISRRR